MRSSSVFAFLACGPPSPKGADFLPPIWGGGGCGGRGGGGPGAWRGGPGMYPMGGPPIPGGAGAIIGGLGGIMPEMQYLDIIVEYQISAEHKPHEISELVCILLRGLGSVKIGHSLLYQINNFKIKCILSKDYHSMDSSEIIIW